MNCFEKTVVGLMVVIGVGIFANDATAGKAKDKTVDQKQASEQPRPTPPVTQSSKKKATKSDPAPFVDKDGDGINDGKENRFRRSGDNRKRRRAKMLQRSKKRGTSAGSSNQQKKQGS